MQKKTEWTAKDRERRRRVRELFKDKPTIDQLVAHGIPTLPSLARYAQAVGLQLEFSLAPGANQGQTCRT